MGLARSRPDPALIHYADQCNQYVSLGFGHAARDAQLLSAAERLRADARQRDRGGDASWGDSPAYVIGPLIGAVVATVSYDAIARPREFDEPGPPQGTAGDIEGRAPGRFARGEERRGAPVGQPTRGEE